MLTGQNSILNRAQEAKEQTEISNEKEKIENAVIQAIAENKYGNIRKEDLEKKLNNDKENPYEILENGDGIVVRLSENDRYYEIENDGKVIGPKYIIEDKYAGDLSKGRNLRWKQRKTFSNIMY